MPSAAPTPARGAAPTPARGAAPTPARGAAPTAAAPARAANRPPRRRVLGALAAGAAAAVSGCRSGSGGARPRGRPAASDPDPLLPDLMSERQLLSAYEMTLKAHPRLAPLLRPLRANHVLHVTALEKAIAAARGDAPAAGEPSPTVLPSLTGRATPTPATVPSSAATEAAALAALRTRERAAAAASSASAVRASGSRAALLASIAACAASHAALLG
jgi:hypothetical protein